MSKVRSTSEDLEILVVTALSQDLGARPHPELGMSLSSDRPSLESSLTNQAVAAAEGARQLGAAGDRTSSVAEGGAVRESTIAVAPRDVPHTASDAWFDGSRRLDDQRPPSSFTSTELHDAGPGHADERCAAGRFQAWHPNPTRRCRRGGAARPNVALERGGFDCSPGRRGKTKHEDGGTWPTAGGRHALWSTLSQVAVGYTFIPDASRRYSRNAGPGNGRCGQERSVR